MTFLWQLWISLCFSYVLAAKSSFLLVGASLKKKLKRKGVRERVIEIECVCVCVRERERERERKKERFAFSIHVPPKP